MGKLCFKEFFAPLFSKLRKRRVSKFIKGVISSESAISSKGAISSKCESQRWLSLVGLE